MGTSVFLPRFWFPFLFTCKFLASGSLATINGVSQTYSSHERQKRQRSGILWVATSVFTATFREKGLHLPILQMGEG